METADEIWKGDLFGRRSEAEDISGYLQSVTKRPRLREDGHAHVLAVDGRYGEGKTFFLRRFARHMRMSHPVAFVDAWVDDLEDEPLVALAATLEEALAPYTTTDATMADRLRDFRDKAGRVSKIVSVGLLKRGAGLIITQGAAELLGGELAKGSEAEKEIKTEALKGAGQGLVDEATNALFETSAPAMDAKIARFREGQRAIQAMKNGLSAVVERLTELGIPTPITIVIDELDRCRPTYAIKLLEEVKHLFDVPGVAFVLGLHAGQLTFSVAAAYGPGFDAHAYLRRFFNRRYALKPAKLDALIQALIDGLSIPLNRMHYPSVRMRDGGGSRRLEPQTLIADLMRAHNLAARDAFELMEMLQTAMGLTAPHNIQISYLLPLIIAHMKGQDEPITFSAALPWNFVFWVDNYGRELSEVSWQDFARDIHAAVKMPRQQLMNGYNSDSENWGLRTAAENLFGDAPTDSYARFQNYGALLSAVKRFS